MDKITLIRWCVGLVGISILAGLPLSYIWYAVLCRVVGIQRKLPLFPKLPLKETGQLTGLVERVFFTVCVAMSLSGTAIAMITWVLVKNSILWPGFAKNGDSAQHTVSLLSTIGSLLIAILGAAICRAGGLF